MMHEKIANEVIYLLHDAFPNAAIALTGSVSYGTNKKDSDIDLLFINENIKNSYNIAFHYQGIRISIFIYNIQYLQRNELGFLCNYFVTPISLIFRSKIIYDPNYIIYDMKEYIFNFFIKRNLLKDRIMSDLKKKIRQFLKINTSDIVLNKDISYTIIHLIITIFYLKEFGSKVNTKEENINPLYLIKINDIELYNILISSIPYHNKTYDKMIQAYKYLLLKY